MARALTFVRRTRGARTVAFFFCTLALTTACGEGDGTTSTLPDAGPGDALDSGGASSPATLDIEGCVVPVLASSCTEGLSVPHQVQLLDAKTGEPLPGFKTTSASGGKYTFKGVPADIEIAVHAIGVGPISEGVSTYDSISLYVPNTGDNLLRVSTVGTAGLAAASANFEPSDDRTPLSGTVYQVDASGKRVGQIGCAKIFLDGEPHPATNADQRYNASSGIPTTLRKLDKTLANSGRFYFGNVSKGAHTLKVSLDDGKSFVAQRDVFVGKSRAEADSPYKAVLYLVGIDVKGANPTPANCPSEEAQ
ncbi:MAG TPA: hypothetical protein VMF89_21570 [Polyangiales bacterium]|nr:hypothetical protein [Polyangiales bacterium]